ncbi:MAG: ACP S-malonyltransferase [Dehalococcoidia bacterium]|jgi:[acyl-carrier-protein] S-malonyltransferase|nr:MAG: [acyl-carrier-protein] S-malonyltransferase [Chloroflexota bacterium]
MSKSNIALMFPGQGAQQPGMANLILNSSIPAQKLFQEANDVLKFDLTELCKTGSEKELSNTLVTQPAIIATSIALFNYMQEKIEHSNYDISPKLFAGHSLGLLTAAIASNCIAFSDGIKIASKRAEIMQSNYIKKPVGMLGIIGLDIEKVKTICKQATKSLNDRVDIANYNLNNQVVIAGHQTAIIRSKEIVSLMRAKAIELKLKVSSHTELHIDESMQFAKFIDKYHFNEPNVPILSNISSKLLDTAEKIKDELSNQIHRPVFWYKNMEFMSMKKINTYIEIGPGHVLSKLVKKYKPNVEAISIFEELKDIDLLLRNYQVDFQTDE